MKNKIKQVINTKYFHVSMLSVIIFVILFVAGIVILKYNVEGEGNLPFIISKISIISNIDGTDVEDTENRWNLAINQNNDIYLYINKNEEYEQTETIESIVIDEFVVKETPKLGEVKILKPDKDSQNVIFKNVEENEVNAIEYKGDLESNVKEQKIANQGGLVVFRCSLKNISTFISNDEEEINHSELLNKLSINNDDLKFKISFNIYINLNSKKTYKATAEFELPINNVVNDGVQSIEITDLDNIVFKRI